jgi:hypothetical protein
MRDYAVSTKVTTPDGTVYYYEAVRQPNDTHGNCRPNGSIVAVDNAGNEVYAEQVLKWVEDRHGNRTEYEYVYIDNVYHSYYRSDGSRGTAVVRKAFVKTVRNASGFTLTVDWNFESGDGYEYDAQCRQWCLRHPRVTAVRSSDGRVVQYGYGASWEGSVTTVVSPAGRITQYEYTNWAVPSDYTELVERWGLSTSESWLLRCVRDMDNVTLELHYNSEYNYDNSTFISDLRYAVQVISIKLLDGSGRWRFRDGSYWFEDNYSDIDSVSRNCASNDETLYGKTS